MKKIIYIFIFFSTISCSLDLPIEDEITGLEAIDNVSVANEILAGAYLSFPKNRVLFSTLSDSFYPNYHIIRMKDISELYRWQNKEYIQLSDNQWSNYYETIIKLNLLLNRIPKITIVGREDENTIKYIEAQALALKGYCYFYLIDLYTPAYKKTSKNSPGIILKNVTDAEELTRISLEKSYENTEKLLIKALSLFDDKITDNLHLSYKSTKAILAKLYLNWGKYNKAIRLCDELIHDNDLNEANYISSWKNPENNPEVLLAFENELFYYNRFYDKSQNQIFYCNPNITFSNTDYRKAVTLIPNKFHMIGGDVIDVNYIGKYQTNLNYQKGTSILAIREAELYFIKAEAEYQLGQKQKAKQTLNTFLALRNAELISDKHPITLEKLLSEKQKEFLGEGLRFSDLKRNRMNLQRVNATKNEPTFIIKSEDFRWTFPIPKNEIKQNKNAKQNPNWENYVY